MDTAFKHTGPYSGPLTLYAPWPVRGPCGNPVPERDGTKEHNMALDSYRAKELAARIFRNLSRAVAILSQCSLRLAGSNGGPHHYE